ncbi:hypothetical protein MTO96_005829 [Rhipicephalus appendiculatus]
MMAASLLVRAALGRGHFEKQKRMPAQPVTRRLVATETWSRGRSGKRNNKLRVTWGEHDGARSVSVAGRVACRRCGHVAANLGTGGGALYWPDGR